MPRDWWYFTPLWSPSLSDYQLKTKPAGMTDLAVDEEVLIREVSALLVILGHQEPVDVASRKVGVKCWSIIINNFSFNMLQSYEIFTSFHSQRFYLYVQARVNTSESVQVAFQIQWLTFGEKT